MIASKKEVRTESKTEATVSRARYLIGTYMQPVSIAISTGSTTRLMSCGSTAGDVPRMASDSS
jgi:hypothetical protein